MELIEIKEILRKFSVEVEIQGYGNCTALFETDFEGVAIELVQLIKKLTVPAVSICSLPDCNKEVSKNSNTLCIEHAYQRKMQGY